jgi:hypothetical protein
MKKVEEKKELTEFELAKQKLDELRVKNEEEGGKEIQEILDKRNLMIAVQHSVENNQVLSVPVLVSK